MKKVIRGHVSVITTIRTDQSGRFTSITSEAGHKLEWNANYNAVLRLPKNDLEYFFFLAKTLCL